MKINEKLLYCFLVIKITVELIKLPNENKKDTYFYPDKDIPISELEEVKHIINDIEKAFSVSDNLAFQKLLKKFIRKKNLSSSEVYTSASIEKSYFYQILKGTHIPSREIVIRICLALKIDLEESRELMAAVGYCFFEKSRRDIIILNCIKYKTGLFLAETILIYFDEKGLMK